MEKTYFRSGLGLKSEVKPLIDSEYQSGLVERIRSRGYSETYGDITVHLAQEFGFCYGVDRAVDYAYETRIKFPEKRIFLLGEIIHNPHVNHRIKEMGIEVIYPETDAHFSFDHITSDDVVIIPAFGVTLNDFNRLRELGCVLVDTTCGSVLVVWKRVEAYARDGFTAVIHGKSTHEESRATASQVNKHPGGIYLIIRDMAEADLVCDYIAKRPGHLDRDAFYERFKTRATDGFDPDRDLKKIGVANQTTMLANESLAIGAKIREAFVEAYGEDHAEEHYRSFGTICSATQERQDAVVEMMKEPPDIMIVIGGYNSSNTNHLAHMCRTHTRTYHIQDATSVDVDSGAIRHKKELAPDSPEVEEGGGWLPEGPFQLGITAGASTPNNKIGETIFRVLQIRGIDPPSD
jgi:4-hydroxy-3-methylbut-2-enyl diphosphate reductase